MHIAQEWLQIVPMYLYYFSIAIITTYEEPCSIKLSSFLTRRRKF